MMEGKDNPTFFLLVSLLKRDFSFIPFFSRIGKSQFSSQNNFHPRQAVNFFLLISYANTHALLISISHSNSTSLCLFPFGKMDFEFDKKNIDILCCYFIFFFHSSSRWCTKVLKKHETAINKQHQFSSELHFSGIKMPPIFHPRKFFEIEKNMMNR